MSTSSPSVSRRDRVASVSVVGAGRLGRALSHALRTAGFEVTGPTGRGEDVAYADVVLLCVPDREITSAASRIQRGPRTLVGHTSGATPLEGLPVDFSLHPLQTFTGDDAADAFAGIGVAVAGRSDAVRATAIRLAEALGARPFTVTDENRATYHAAASIASNFLVTLEATAEQVAAGAGLDAADARGLLAPLVRRTVENWAAHGPIAALTGPVARRDDATVGRQRDAVATTAPQALPLFDALVDRTRALAASVGPSAVPASGPEPGA